MHDIVLQLLNGLVVGFSLALVASGQIDPKPLVTHRFGLQEVAQAFATVQDPASGSVKVIVEIA